MTAPVSTHARTHARQITRLYEARWFFSHSPFIRSRNQTFLSFATFWKEQQLFQIALLPAIRMVPWCLCNLIERELKLRVNRTCKESRYLRSKSTHTVHTVLQHFHLQRQICKSRWHAAVYHRTISETVNYPDILREILMKCWTDFNLRWSFESTFLQCRFLFTLQSEMAHFDEHDRKTAPLLTNKINLILWYILLYVDSEEKLLIFSFNDIVIYTSNFITINLLFLSDISFYPILNLFHRNMYKIACVFQKKWGSPLFVNFIFTHNV